jgi:ADP-heptose:LPS heptosyltransferase
LKGVVNLIGKTNLRQLIRLVYHSVGILTGVSLPMHLAAAVESKNGLLNRPCVVIAGGREPVQWEAYPHHRFLAVNGAMLCCDNGGCWKSRCQLVGDGDKKDTEDTCLNPVDIRTNPAMRIPKCMDMIKSEDVIRAIQQYYTGGVLKYN